MEIKKVGVVGCGLMGAGITEVCIRAGYSTKVLEVNQEFLDRGMNSLKASLDTAVKKGKLTEQDRNAALGRLQGTIKMDDFKDCDLVIEAVIENLDEKKKVFAALDQVCPQHAILASNTSCLSILDMAMATKRATQVVGLHFFQPAPVMGLVELIRTIVSSDEVVNTVKDFASSIGKKVVNAKDMPGFTINRVLVPYVNSAIRTLESGVATKEDIDLAVVMGMNHPMGPFQVCDFVGLDTIYQIDCLMYEEFKDPIYAPPPLLKKMVTAGHLGRKSGKGFYDY
ncbi:3-hydroxyacyl-CoA dehydrogenase family protein [Chloroflexota bacterium]